MSCSTCRVTAGCTFLPSLPCNHEGPQMIVEVANSGKDEITSAQEAMDSIFAMFGKAKYSKEAKIPKELQLDTPTVSLKEPAQISDKVVDILLEKLLERMKGKVAIITNKTQHTKCGFKSGDSIEYLVFEDDGNNTEALYNEFGNSALDGVIEDLKGPIEIVKKP